VFCPKLSSTRVMLPWKPEDSLVKYQGLSEVGQGLSAYHFLPKKTADDIFLFQASAVMSYLHFQVLGRRPSLLGFPTP
jgi:hypothetical protein